jgi:hypothetical protein
MPAPRASRAVVCAIRSRPRPSPRASAALRRRARSTRTAARVCAARRTTARRCVALEPAVCAHGDRDGLPAGWVGSSLGCLANCDPSPTDVSCPPGMACYRGALVPVGARTSESACYFGFYGAPCRDDAECFVGRCTDVGGGCAAVHRDLRGRGACEPPAARAGVPGARRPRRWRSARASSSVVLRARPTPRASRVAASAAAVAAMAPGPTTSAPTASSVARASAPRPCFDPMGCFLSDDGGNPLANGYCDFESGLCERLLDRGALCTFDAECATGLCAPPIPTAESRCDVPRGPTRFCSRDEECLSGRCIGSPMACDSATDARAPMARAPMARAPMARAPMARATMARAPMPERRWPERLTGPDQRATSASAQIAPRRSPRR